MALVVFIIGLAFVVVALAYDYYRDVRHSKQIIQTFSTSDNEIKKLRANERHLRDEINILQNKLRHTREDPVTNLLGWQLFEDRVTQNIKESERYQFTMGVLYVDIDDFKVVIEAMGYEVGDKLLQEVARRLEQCIRQVDSISRFTKDTFVLLLAQLAKPETAAIVAQRILQTLSQPFQIDGQELFITACIGIAFYPNDAQDTQSLLRKANHALHMAKKEGKHVSKFYQERMHLQSQRDILIYNSLNKESIYQELSLFFQPIKNVNTNTIFCMDASVCWPNAELGVVSTAELFDYAERQRKINNLSSWMLKSACTHFINWRKNNFKPNLIGLPLSIKQLENSNFIYQLSHVLQSINFNPEWLMVDIKESLTEESAETIDKAFNMLNYLGINICIDNFGTGSFSLKYLKKNAIQYLKLSPILIDDLEQNEKTSSLLKSLILMGQAVGVEIIVKGIEKEEQIPPLKELGFTFMQGKALGEPISADEVLNKIAIPTA